MSRKSTITRMFKALESGEKKVFLLADTPTYVLAYGTKENWTAFTLTQDQLDRVHDLTAFNYRQQQRSKKQIDEYLVLERVGGPESAIKIETIKK